MHIAVQLLGSYRSLVVDSGVGSASVSVTVAEGARVADLLAQLPVPVGTAPTALVNGRHAELDQRLMDGDVVTLFPAAGGG
ncbi:MAG TPA: MoaD/ThiS family protein [Anaerolineae bacterium]|nr:MoaD/ThiS family protein [Anaerolineae bacterium]